MSCSNLRYIFNLANSIIGVGVLAMPYCFSQCGILLAIVLLLCCNFLTRITCYLLMKSSQLTCRKSYESLALHTFGPMGKLMVAISITGFLIGCLIAFFVVMGDLGPEVITNITGVQKSAGLRTMMLVFVGLFVILPFSLLRKLDSLTIVSVMSLVFYLIFILKILIQSLPNLWSGEFAGKVLMWNTGGILTCLPIFTMALSCQTQFFEIYNIVPDPSVKKMSSIVTGAVNMCTTIYITVGILGYITFYNVEMKGNLLTMFPSSLITEAVRCGFVLTVALSFPLVIFPCRASIHSLLCGKGNATLLDPVAKLIPDNQFKMITISIVFGTWMIGVLIPNIELVLGLNGSTVGTIICIILPTTIFIKIVTKNTNEKLLAQIVFGIGVFILVASTYATLQNADQAERSKLEKNFLASATLKVPDNIVKIEDVKKEAAKSINNISFNVNNNMINNSKKEPPIPVEPIVKKENKDKKEVPDLLEKSKDEQIQEKDAIIQKLAEKQEENEKIIQLQKEQIEDIKKLSDGVDNVESNKDIQGDMKRRIAESKVTIPEVENSLDNNNINKNVGKSKLTKNEDKANVKNVNVNRNIDLANNENKDLNIAAPKISDKQNQGLPELGANKNNFGGRAIKNNHVHQNDVSKDNSVRIKDEGNKREKKSVKDIGEKVISKSVSKNSPKLKKSKGVDRKIRIEIVTPSKLVDQNPIKGVNVQEPQDPNIRIAVKNEMRKLHEESKKKEI